MRAVPGIPQLSAGRTTTDPSAVAGRTARWAMVAGVTGCVANALLATLYADLLLDPAGHGRFAWTGPANDIVGAVSTAATIPVVLGMRTLVGPTRALRGLALVVPWAAVALILASALLVLGTIDFTVQVVVAVPYTGLLFAWCLALGRAGRTSQESQRLTAGALTIGVVGCSGLSLAVIAFAFPYGSIAQVATGAPAVLLGALAFLAIPIWLIRVSSRLTNHAESHEPVRAS